MRPPLRLLIVFLVLGGSGCAPRVNVGSSLLWFAEHETGDFSEWTAGSKGGYAADTPDTSVTITTDVAHSGTHSVKLANAAPTAYETARLYREDAFPTEAYYSAWFRLPQLYQTTEDWTIMQFNVPPTDGGSTGALLDVDLRSLASGEMILDIYDHRPEYLRSPTAEPAIPVPIGQWFQIEVFYRNVGDDTGRFTLWLDGQVNYDLHRPFGLSSTTYWSPCSSTEGLSPTQSDLYVDDAAVSLVRVGPTGTL
ncbi:MAG TPA: heparin lyase I family protein [Polyangia bacterium]|nr:heparin lyase I family protein [Polyangia bacterium]